MMTMTTMITAAVIMVSIILMASAKSVACWVTFSTSIE
jgi:hypothetical protein